MRRALALFVVTVGVTVGCNAVWGIEGAESQLAPPAGNDTGPVDPCAPQPGVAKVCLKFEKQQHAAYDVGTGADALKIDGRGVIRLQVFDEDPDDAGALYTSRVQLPADGSELDINSFPATIPIVLTPGKHWFIAQFEDTKAGRAVDRYPAGDFITVPGVSGTKLVYPSVEAIADGSATASVPLQPLRRVNLELQADASMRSAYSTYQVNGDGPLAFGFFDGEFSAATRYLEVVSAPCAAAAPLTSSPPIIRTYFTSTVTGTHNLLAALEDYGATGAFPSDGALVTATTSNVPSLTIVPTTWTTNASLKFVSVLNPFRAGEKADEVHCP